ncbi:MAG: sigma-70 family RNA polymerase sigma factor [Ardenticatenaceae bacterium]|nr:sigma-70 family RNA polymerase sigma factor [Anaerolineales bacterium]MCB8921789.1 sigma-70 family RNA polymerase sigma factor [Ardenticatenaceae bacterium]
MQIDDRVLVQRAQQGNTQAIGALYDRHHHHIFRFVWSRTNNQALAEDLTGEVFTRMVTHLPQYQTRGVPFRAWLYRIARNLIVDHQRQHNQHTIVDIEQAANLSVDEDDPMALTETALTRETLQHALGKLDPVQREVIELRFLLGLSLQEVAQTLDKTVSAVKSLQHRGLKSLRRTLATLEIRS